MIDIEKILKRAWQILWSYRVLWIFGVLLAITMGSFPGGNGSNGVQYNFDGRDWGNARPWPQLEEFNNWAEKNLAPLFTNPEQHITTFIWIAVGLLLFSLVVGVITALVRYVSETAVLCMVNDHEQTGQKLSFSQGWRLGWSRPAFRMWLIDLVISIPVFLFILILALVGLAVYLSVTDGSEFTAVFGIVAALGLLFVFIFLFVIGMAFLGLLREFFIRQAALENASVGESFRRGWQMFKRNWKGAGLMWLVMVGLGIGAAIAGFIMFFLLIPAYIVLLIPALLVGAVPGLLVFGITSLFASGPLAWILGILAALPFFFTILFLPLFLINGWFKIFTSSSWTLAFREMKAREAVQPDSQPDATKSATP
ncbi:MAG: DUF7544 domain-containing protein [Bellilinea sp.]